jgi:hypothetical protein
MPLAERKILIGELVAEVLGPRAEATETLRALGIRGG